MNKLITGASINMRRAEFRTKPPGRESALFLRFSLSFLAAQLLIL